MKWNKLYEAEITSLVLSTIPKHRPFLYSFLVTWLHRSSVTKSTYEVAATSTVC